MENHGSFITWSARKDELRDLRDAPSTRFGSISRFSPWFPEADPHNGRALSWLRRLTDRDIALVLILLLSSTILVLNLTLTIFSLAKYGYHEHISDILGPHSGGTCDKVKTYNTWLHFGINALSTLLLGASNYCAQLLVAPTRAEVDVAHSHQRWLDIGIQSFRNLRRVGWKRRAVWYTLMLSSGFLHLFWNSAVFATTPFSTYSLGYLTSDFLDDDRLWESPQNNLGQFQSYISRLQNLSKEDCIYRYANPIAGHRDVFIVSENITMQDGLSFEMGNVNSSLIYNDTSVPGGIFWRFNTEWMCTAWPSDTQRSRVSCTRKHLHPYVDIWTVVTRDFTEGPPVWLKVAYCLSTGEDQPMEDKCALRVSKVILGFVTALNLLKCVCIAYTIHVHSRERMKNVSESTVPEERPKKTIARAVKTIFSREEPPERTAPYLVTIGDAIASFLQQESPQTANYIFATKKDFIRSGSWPTKIVNSGLNKPSIRWYRATSARRWLITLSLCLATIIIVVIILYKTIVHQRGQGADIRLSSLWAYGFGQPRQWAVALTNITGKLGVTYGFFFAVFFANSYQVFISALYLLYNNLLTVMVVAAEWNDFITERKPLRVSSPRSFQRSTYTLSLPYRYSITLIMLSCLLHYLISQSVFVVQTIGYRTPDFRRDADLDTSTIGFSSIAIMFALSIHVFMITGLLVVSFYHKYRPNSPKDGGPKPPYPMPLVSTCSVAIAANCHRPEGDDDCWYLPVRWDFVRGQGGIGGRFSFTTAVDVEYPTAIDIEYRYPGSSHALGAREQEARGEVGGRI